MTGLVSGDGRMQRLARSFGTFVLLAGLLLLLPEAIRVRAASGPPGPDRYTTIVVKYTLYEWWLVRWDNNGIECRFFTDHDGLPTGGEIYNSCGKTIYKEWIETLSCPQGEIGVDTSACDGYYLQLVTSKPAQREIGVALPPPVVWVSLENCTPKSTSYWCHTLPTLVLVGEDPLPNETILSVEGTIDGKPFTCGQVCKLPLGPTNELGIIVEFWAYSSYGDSSERFEALVRVLPAEEGLRQVAFWYADVLSTQWTGTPVGSCAQSWESFPPPGGPPHWLTTPEHPTDLESNISYEYLAANLIVQGVVDVSECPDKGLTSEGTASLCGLEAAQPAVTEWQNRFDHLIFDVAQETGIPAQLLKNLFSRESQFWPGVFTDAPEFGLGQMTENGADTALLWNSSFYEQFCPLVLDVSVCKKGYARLKAEEQAILRGAVVRSVNAFCAECPLGLDLQQADFSVGVFAQTLLANCEQTGRIVRNVARQAPGKVVGYEDMWRFALVNYNAGPGCLSIAVQDTWNDRQPLDWEHVSVHLTPVCQGAIDYVEDISR